MERIQDDYRRESAKPQERKEFTELIASIDYAESEISRLSDEISNLEDDRILQRMNQKNCKPS